MIELTDPLDRTTYEIAASRIVSVHPGSGGGSRVVVTTRGGRTVTHDAEESPGRVCDLWAEALADT